MYRPSYILHVVAPKDGLSSRACNTPPHSELRLRASVVFSRKGFHVKIRVSRVSLISFYLTNEVCDDGW